YASVHFNVTATGGKIDDIKTDPTGQDSQNASSAASTNSGADLAQAYQGAPSPTIPCLPEAAREGNCDKYPSAIGDIDTTPAGFIKAAFSLVLGLAGGIAVILIIIAGYQFMTSQGNPERIQAARERLISAIVGLVFIIFSVVILQVIGVDLLHLPGFGNQSVSTTGSAAPASGTSNCIVNGCSDISSYCLPPNPGMCVSPHTVPEGATCHDVHVNRDIDQACDPGLTCQSGKCEPTSQP
ncbi:MAG TPA: pilin, partial [Candidatus Saccharimonadales bacterium]|nr:pilin [Candidatus Saccharimonadales bacterium]